MRRLPGLNPFLLCACLLAVGGCASPDPLQIALEQRTVTYVGGSDYVYVSPSTLR